MIFKQLFEPVSSTYTYLLGCEQTGQAVLVDPVINTMDRDLQVLKELRLRLVCTIDTHIHADHITAALELNPPQSMMRPTPVTAAACAALRMKVITPAKLPSRR